MSEVLNFEIDKQAWDDLVNRLNANLAPAQQHRLLDELAVRSHKITVEQMRARAHRHGAGITEKWEVSSPTADSREVRAVSPVVGYLEWGTPTPVLPTHGEFLYFENLEGQLIRKRSVRGITAQHNVERLVLPKVEAECLRRMEEVATLVENG